MARKTRLHTLSTNIPLDSTGLTYDAFRHSSLLPIGFRPWAESGMGRLYGRNFLNICEKSALNKSTHQIRSHEICRSHHCYDRPPKDVPKLTDPLMSRGGGRAVPKDVHVPHGGRDVQSLPYLVMNSVLVAHPSAILFFVQTVRL